MMHVQYFLPTVQVFSQKERNLCKSNYMYIGIRVTIVINLSLYGEIPSMQHVIT